MTSITDLPTLPGGYLASDVVPVGRAGVAYQAPAFGLIPNAKGDGVTDDSVALQTAMNIAAAIGGGLTLGPFTYIATGLQIPAGLHFLCGAGKYATVIKRPANDPAITYMLSNSGTISAIEICNFTLDGNLANNPTNAGAGFVLGASSTHFDIHNVVSKNHRATVSHTYGWGGYISGDFSLTTPSSVNNCEFLFCGGTGLEIIAGCANMSVTGNAFIGNYAGFNIDTSTTDFSSYGGLISGNNASYNSQSGIAVSGYVPGSNYDFKGAVFFSIVGNTAVGNGAYGIAWQATFGTISNNTVSNNGTPSLLSSVYAGILFNGTDSVCSGNLIDQNAFWGIDAGGGINNVIIGNYITRNGLTAGSGCGVNLGACVNCLVEGNQFSLNCGSTGGGSEISLTEVDGGGLGNFPQVASRIVIRGNHFVLHGTLAGWGIICSSSVVPSVVIENNSFAGGISPTSFVFAATSPISIRGNRDVSSPDAYYVSGFTGTAPLTLPDFVEEVLYSSGVAATITSIQTYSQNYTATQVAGVIMTAAGSGYSSVTPPTVTISGDGTGATGVAVVSNTGTVVGINLTATGTGYTAATVAFTGGGGTGAACVAAVGCPNQTVGKKVSIYNGGATNLTLQRGARLLCVGGNIVMTPGSVVSFYGGNSGNFYETSRAIQ